jgi:regulator of sirC expression with transglutaminase-like and TPR domain
MDFKLTVPSSLEFFASLVAGNDDFPLLEAASAIAQDDFPSLSVEQTLDEVDQLKLKLRARLPKHSDILARLRALNTFFYDQMGFAGNVNNYDDPHNSFIHLVLSTRKGIPITLAVLWLELAREIGLAASGVSFPGHFLMKVELSSPQEGQVVIDPFTGASLSKEDIAERLLPWLMPSEDSHSVNRVSDEILAQYLEPANSRQMLTRMLRNLAEIYRRQNDVKRLDAVMRRMDILNP